MKSKNLLVELTVIPVGGSTHSSKLLARVLEVIARSGLPYQLTPSATCLQGPWETVIPVIKTCHDLAAKQARHVVTLIKIEQDFDADSQQPLARNLESVESKTGEDLQTTPPRGVRRSGGKMARKTAARR